MPFGFLSSWIDSSNQKNYRYLLDQIFVVDATTSVLFGILAILSPHGFIQYIGGGQYNHDAHEILRLYGVLRLAFGWILFHLRQVDDGKFRKIVCEALCIAYMIQSIIVLRAELTSTTNTNTILHWMAFSTLLALTFLYGFFRFSKRGNLIKVYELPSSLSSTSSNANI